VLAINAVFAANNKRDLSAAAPRRASVPLSVKVVSMQFYTEIILRDFVKPI